MGMIIFAVVGVLSRGSWWYLESCRRRKDAGGKYVEDKTARTNGGSNPGPKNGARTSNFFTVDKTK